MKSCELLESIKGYRLGTNTLSKRLKMSHLNICVKKGVKLHLIEHISK